MIRAEVAALVQETIDDILAQTSQNVSQGRELAVNIIRYLEGDAAWVELYSATGELLIPSTLEIHEGLRELFTSLQQVLYVAAIRLAPIHIIFILFPRGSPTADRPRSHHPRGGKSGSQWIFHG